MSDGLEELARIRAKYGMPSCKHGRWTFDCELCTPQVIHCTSADTLVIDGVEVKACDVLEMVKGKRDENPATP